MWQANAPIESRYAPQQEDVDPVAQQRQQLYAQAMGDLGQQQSAPPKGIVYPKQEDSSPMKGIMKMFKGGSNGNSTTMAGPDVGSFGATA